MTQENKNIKALILFSGTGSVEKGIDRINLTNPLVEIEYRGVDMDNKFEPYYNVNILEWDFKEALKDFIPDYLHSSFVCCEFSSLKNGSNQTRDLDKGFALINKTIEIYEYLLTLNPKLVLTCENPRNKFARNHTDLLKLNRETCCYCKYGFKYMKPTDFFCNIKLKLNMCSKKEPCDFRKKNNYHEVCLGFDHKHLILQIPDSKHFSNMRKAGLIPPGFNNTYMRYRIPDLLIDSILEQVMSHIYIIKLENDMNDLVITDEEENNCKNCNMVVPVDLPQYVSRKLCMNCDIERFTKEQKSKTYDCLYCDDYLIKPMMWSIKSKTCIRCYQENFCKEQEEV